MRSLKVSVLKFPLEIDLGLDSSLLKNNLLQGNFEIEVRLIKMSDIKLSLAVGYGVLFLKEGSEMGKKPQTLILHKNKQGY